jgi:regulator of sigma E protease
MVSILAFILVIAICVIIHEGGHYVAAIWRNVQVHEFAFGMGPGIITKRGKSGTIWAWRLFPIGGFVRLEGEEDDPRPGDVPDYGRSINARRPWERFVIIAGGAIMNIILAWFLMTLLLSVNGIYGVEPVVGKLMEGYPAERMGARPDDRVLSINGHSITKWKDIRETLKIIDTDEVSIVVLRGNEDVTLSGTVPISERDNVRLWGVQPSLILTKYPIYKAVYVSLGQCLEFSVMILQGLWGMIIGKVAPDVSGPVGIAKMAGEAATMGFWSFVAFLAIINLNLGLLNLLPLPALDGGRLVFVLGEMVFGRKFPEKWENRIHLVGFAALIALIVFVTWQDIAKLLAGN